MSVRSGILAVLSLGPAYGSQVHGEVETRMHRVGQINVGQIYSTLDRLQSQGFVMSEGMTRDGLPLYALTARGRVEVETLVSTADAGCTWSDFVGHVLLVASLPGVPVDDLLRAYREAFLEDEPPAGGTSEEPLAALGQKASRILSGSALAWLDEVQQVLSTTELARPLASMRPRRGRRPREAS